MIIGFGLADFCDHLFLWRSDPVICSWKMQTQGVFMGWTKPARPSSSPSRLVRTRTLNLGPIHKWSDHELSGKKPEVRPK